MIHLYTIGFTKKSAEAFFTKLRTSGVKRIIDVRLNNVSQLAGFTKKDDLPYFLKVICGIEYIHMPILAPTKDMFDVYKKHNGDWSVYEQKFLDLMSSRRVEDVVSKDVLDYACFLCSEDEPHHCHRRLIAEYLDRKWQNIQITHLT
jgi:uncharacterized protein (DUF488 family)